mmetsp:Transcript_16437/g.34192  ORF Transcript_16437/g.34192 Transcript_16437/m.34192 type:complete len:81 (-) Transcript_16437:151-393(-)
MSCIIFKRNFDSILDKGHFVECQFEKKGSDAIKSDGEVYYRPVAYDSNFAYYLLIMILGCFYMWVECQVSTSKYHYAWYL